MAEDAFFQGSINEAISKSQIERKLFVVSLQDDSNASRQLDSVTWTDAQVKTVLRNECIAIRLVKGTQQAEQFVQIYSPTQCPSIYFLAQGFPFLIIPGFVSPSEFIQKFRGVQLAYSSALTSSLTSSNVGTSNPISSTSTPATTSSTNNQTNSYSAARTSNEPKTSTNTSNNNNNTKPVASPPNNNNATTDADLDDEEEARQLIMKQYKKTAKSTDGTNTESRPLTQEEIDEQVKKYEEKLKEIRARKAKEKEEEERNKELERIKSAKEMQAARAKIEEIKRQKEIEKRKKEQEEEKAYKEKLRLQIQKDKEERERRAKQGLAESTDSTTKTAYINANANNTNLTSSASIKSYDKTTLRFRLLNGETLVQEFPGDETLEGVVGFLNNAYNYRVKYSLKTVYPNHVFLPHEYSKTLKQLNLVPNATLILTEAPLNGSGPSGNASLSSSESSGSSWSPFSMLGSVWRWAWGSSDSNNNANNNSGTSSNTSTSANQNTTQGQRNDRVRHRGAGPNVATLGDMRREGGDDRHKSTWNGNSTQQQ